MARFDLYLDPLGDVDFLLDVQSDFHDRLKTRMIIPVQSSAKLGDVIPRLHVKLTVKETVYFAAVNLMTVVPIGQLGRPVASAAAQADEITTAIDFLLQGF